jgi:hypothetical protein
MNNTENAGKPHFHLILFNKTTSAKEYHTRNNLIKMKIEYNNLYTHFVFTTLNGFWYGICLINNHLQYSFSELVTTSGVTF